MGDVLPESLPSDSAALALGRPLTAAALPQAWSGDQQTCFLGYADGPCVCPTLPTMASGPLPPPTGSTWRSEQVGMQGEVGADLEGTVDPHSRQ